MTGVASRRRVTFQESAGYLARGHSALLFLVGHFNELTQGHPLAEAVAKLKCLDEEPDMYELRQPEPA